MDLIFSKTERLANDLGEVPKHKNTTSPKTHLCAGQ